MDLKGSDPLTNKPLSQVRYEQTPWVLDSLQSHSDVNYIIDSSASGRLLEICPRGNNKMVIIVFPCS